MRPQPRNPLAEAVRARNRDQLVWEDAAKWPLMLARPNRSIPISPTTAQGMDENCAAAKEFIGRVPVGVRDRMVMPHRDLPPVANATRLYTQRILEGRTNVSGPVAESLCRHQRCEWHQPVSGRTKCLNCRLHTTAHKAAGRVGYPRARSAASQRGIKGHLG